MTKKELKQVEEACRVKGITFDETAVWHKIREPSGDDWQAIRYGQFKKKLVLVNAIAVTCKVYIEVLTPQQHFSCSR